MSNQAHKARMRTSDRLKEDIFAASRRAGRQVRGEAKRIGLDPKKNPSGKAEYDIDKASYYWQSGERSATFKPKPDQAHSARLRGASDRKARGTQSSATRVSVK